MASKVFVGNLDFATTRDEIMSVFSEVGPVADVFLPTDRETGRPRGFAFVEFESDGDASKAIEKFNGQQVGGRTIRVDTADDRPRRAPSFGGGGGGGRPPFGGHGGGGGGGKFAGGKSKGSRRNIRARKRGF